MPKFLGYYRIQPGIRCKFDNLVVLECRQLFDHAARWWLEYDPDEVLRIKRRGLGWELIAGVKITVPWLQLTHQLSKKCYAGFFPAAVPSVTC